MLHNQSKNIKKPLTSLALASPMAAAAWLDFSFLEDYECEFRQNNYEIITKENYQ